MWVCLVAIVRVSNLQAMRGSIAEVTKFLGYKGSEYLWPGQPQAVYTGMAQVANMMLPMVGVMAAKVASQVDVSTFLFHDVFQDGATNSSNTVHAGNGTTSFNSSGVSAHVDSPTNPVYFDESDGLAAMGLTCGLMAVLRCCRRILSVGGDGL